MQCRADDKGLAKSSHTENHNNDEIKKLYILV